MLAVALMLNLLPTCPVQGWVTSEYGRRVHPVSGRVSFHEGIDIGNAEGTALVSPWRGQVTTVTRASHAGLYLVVQYGDVSLKMAHLSRADVQTGDTVDAGEELGHMGHSGRATGDHVHIEVRIDGRRVDPSFVRMLCDQLR